MSHNPYPGLRPFRPDEAHLFFGRESQVDAMVDRLAASRFLVVVGSSGCGKSSLVNCGLRPALQRGVLARAGSAWRIASFRPGVDPVRELAEALAAPGLLFDLAGAASPGAAGGAAAGVANGVQIAQADLVAATLRLSKRGLIDLVQQARLPAGTHLLLVVDQFEELFRYRALAHAEQRAPDAAALVNLLLEASAQAEVPVYVVMTMRSDFLGDCTQFNGLAEAINAGQYLVPRLSRDERRAAIAGPAQVAGASISPTLLTRLVNDVGDNPDQLSILQHALNRTWAAWLLAGAADKPLALPHYESIGTMAHALDLHAEWALAELGEGPVQALTERVFKALTDRATDPRGVRRPTRLDKLCELTESTPELLATVLSVFRKPSRSFLMPPADEPLAADSVVDISHESLMRVWERLKRWTDEEAQSAQRYRRLAETAVLHADAKAGLWRDPDLQLALDWRAQARPNAAWAARLAPGFETAMAFLDQSLAERDSEHQRDADLAHRAQLDQRARTRAEAQAEVQGSYARRMKRRAVLSMLMALLAVLMAAQVIYQDRQAANKRSDDDRAQQAARQSKRDDEEKRVNALHQLESQAQLWQDALRRNPELAQVMRPQASQATLYIQFQAEEQRSPAEALRGQAGAQQLNAPGIEKVRAGPAAPELRYFHEQDLREAQQAAAWMQASPGLQALVVKWVPGQGDKVKPGKMELWYGPPAKRLLVVAGLFTQRDNAYAQLQSLKPLGLALRVIETRDYPNLREGFYAVITGPFADEAQARQALETLSGKAKDAYIKPGW